MKLHPGNGDERDPGAGPRPTATSPQPGPLFSPQGSKLGHSQLVMPCPRGLIPAARHFPGSALIFSPEKLSPAPAQPHAEDGVISASTSDPAACDNAERWWSRGEHRRAARSGRARRHLPPRCIRQRGEFAVPKSSMFVPAVNPAARRSIPGNSCNQAEFSWAVPNSSKCAGSGATPRCRRVAHRLESGRRRPMLSPSSSGTPRSRLAGDGWSAEGANQSALPHPVGSAADWATPPPNPPIPPRLSRIYAASAESPPTIFELAAQRHRPAPPFLSSRAGPCFCPAGLWHPWALEFPTRENSDLPLAAESGPDQSALN